MKIDANKFLDLLKVEAEKLIAQSDKLRAYSLEELSLRPHEKSWNVLECLEHMNMYHNYYLPEIKKQIIGAKHSATVIFKSGWFGNYSAENMLPKKEAKVNMPMNTFKNMNPQGHNLQIEVLENFQSQMKQLITLIESGRKVDLRRTKVKLTLRFLKFTLGDTLHFMINHNRRHMLQIQKILSVSN